MANDGRNDQNRRTLFLAHYLPKAENEVDLFDMLISSLLAHYKTQQAVLVEHSGKNGNH